MSYLFLRSLHAHLAVHPITGHQGPRGGVEVQRYLFSSSVLEWGSGQHHAPAALPPGKTRYALYRRLGGPQGRSGRVRKISPRPAFFFRSPDRPVRNQSLHGLSYPAHTPLAVVLGNRTQPFSKHTTVIFVVDTNCYELKTGTRSWRHNLSNLHIPHPRPSFFMSFEGRFDRATTSCGPMRNCTYCTITYVSILN
jgi:hypothetical protein